MDKMKVKKYNLTFQESNDFLWNVVGECLNDESNSITWISKNVAIKKNFAEYYLGYEWKNSDKDFNDNYEVIHNLNLEDYKNDIAYNQLQDILFAIDKELEQKDFEYKQLNRPSIDNLIRSITEYFDLMTKQFKDVDVTEMLSEIKNFANKTAGLEDNDVIKGLIDAIKDKKTN